MDLFYILKWIFMLSKSIEKPGSGRVYGVSDE